MRAALIALLLTIGSQAGAECGNLCDAHWWFTATEADVQAELDGGADVMARTEYGNTPLHSAALSGSPANVQALQAAGADVMARTEGGWTPLHGAGNPEVIQALLNAGADVMARDWEGATPLHLANNSEVIQALLNVGADIIRELKLEKHHFTRLLGGFSLIIL